MAIATKETNAISLTLNASYCVQNSITKVEYVGVQKKQDMFASGKDAVTNTIRVLSPGRKTHMQQKKACMEQDGKQSAFSRMTARADEAKSKAEFESIHAENDVEHVEGLGNESTTPTSPVRKQSWFDYKSSDEEEVTISVPPTGEKNLQAGVSMKKKKQEDEDEDQDGPEQDDKEDTHDEDENDGGHGDRGSGEGRNDQMDPGEGDNRQMENEEEDATSSGGVKVYMQRFIKSVCDECMSLGGHDSEATTTDTEYDFKTTKKKIKTFTDQAEALEAEAQHWEMRAKRLELKARTLEQKAFLWESEEPKRSLLTINHVRGTILENSDLDEDFPLAAPKDLEWTELEIPSAHPVPGIFCEHLRT